MADTRVMRYHGPRPKVGDTDWLPDGRWIQVVGVTQLPGYPVEYDLEVIDIEDPREGT